MGWRTRIALWLALLWLVPEPNLSEEPRSVLLWFNAPLLMALPDWLRAGSNRVLLEVTLVSWWAYITVAKLLAALPSRLFGVGPGPEHWRGFVNAGPPWRPLYRLLVSPFKWWNRVTRRNRPGLLGGDTRANAGMASAPEILATAGRYRPGAMLPVARFTLGNVALNEILAVPLKLGAIFCGQAGSGKTGTFATALLSLTREQSAIFVDIDGELLATVRPWLTKTGHAVHALNFLPGHVTSVYNVFDELRDIERRFGREAVAPATVKAAEAIVAIRNDLQPTFDEGGRRIWSFVVVFVYLRFGANEQSLAFCYHLICSGMPVRETDPKGTTPFDVLFAEVALLAAQDDGCGGLLNDLMTHGVSEWKSGNNREGGNPFHGAAKRAGAGFDLPAVRAATTGRSSVLMADLKEGNAVVGVVCAVDDMKGTYQPLVRLALTMFAHVFQTMPSCREQPALAMCDEAQNVGPLDIVQSGAHARHYEYAPIIGIQDEPGLEKVYKEEGKASIFANAGALVYFATTDPGTSESISRRLGRETVLETVPGTPWYLWPFTPAASRIRPRRVPVERDVANPEQVRDILRPGRGRVMVFSAGMRPFVAALAVYWQVVPVWRYPRGRYAETPGRMLARFAIGRSASALRALRSRWRARLNEGVRSRANDASRTAAPRVDLATALEIFGLREPYTLAEVEARYDVLKGGTAARASEEFAALIEEAREVLIDWRLEKGVAA